MIIVVDDEEVLLQEVERTLVAEGYEVRTATGAELALEAAAQQPPELVITDVRMPGMDGFELHRAYRQRFPQRRTPFVFLSSLSDDRSVVRGLEGGAEDYLVKPVSGPVLRAKVRSLLRRQTTRRQLASFRGDLAKLPFVSVLKFCEVKGLTGVVEVQAGELTAQVEFAAGEMSYDDVDLDQFDQLCELTEGTFAIASHSVGFDEIAPSAVADEEPITLRSASHPGQLSGVRLAGRLFQIQTEVVSHPAPSVVTIITLDGRTLSKRSRKVPPAADADALGAMIREQHAQMEREVADRVGGATAERSPAEPSTDRERFHQLFDDGYEQYRQGRHAEALTLWEQARDIDPESKSLMVNLEIVKAKLGPS